MGGRQFFHDKILGKVGILVLIHEDVVVAILILVEHIREVAQQDVHKVKQVIEVHRVGVAQAGVVAGKYLGNVRFARSGVLRRDVVVVGILLSREEV